MKNMMARWTVEERTRAVDIIKPASEERIKPASGTSSNSSLESSGREDICLYFCILINAVI